MDFTKKSCEEFVSVLATKEPVPGGGGAAALVGAVGVALGNMVGSLTVGKKKYADVEDEMNTLMEQCQTLEQELLAAINELGIGPQGFGGRTTCLGLAIEQMPTHVAGLPAAVNVSCHVTRRASAEL